MKELFGTEDGWKICKLHQISTKLWPLIYVIISFSVSPTDWPV